MTLADFESRLIRHWRRWLVVIAVLGAALRIIYVAMTPPVLENDAVGYDRLAKRLLSGEGMAFYAQPSAERTPGYPLFIAAIYSLGGNPQTVRLAQAALEGATIFLMGALGILIGVAPGGILAAALLTAIFPPLIQQPAELYSETLYQFLLILAFVLALDAASFKRGLLAGIAWGMAVLIRPAAVYWIPILAVIIALRSGRNYRAAGAALLLAAVITISPWLIRNARVVGAPVMSTLGYQNIYVYNARLDSDDWQVVQQAFGATLRELGERIGWGEDIQRTRRDVQIDSLCRAEAQRLIREHPGRFAALSLKKVACLWGNVGYGVPASRKSVAVALFIAALMALVLVQFVRRRAWREFAVLTIVLFFVYHTALHAVSIAFFRHNTPILPIFFLLAAWALWKRNKSATLEQG